VAMMDNGIKSGLGHVQIRPAGYEESRKMGMLLEDPDALKKKVSGIKMENVFSSDRFEKEGLLRIGSFTRGVLFIGINPESEKSVSLYADWMDEGSFLSSKNSGAASKIIPCLIGRMNADKMEIGAGDWAVLSLSDQRGTYKSLRCSVQGIFSSSIEPIDKYTVLVRREDLSQFFAEKDNLISYFVFLGKSVESSEEIKKTLIMNFQDKDSLEILAYSDLEKYFTSAMEMIEYFEWIFYFILLIGVALILFDSIMMSIYERMQELGIMHAIGSRPGFIFFMVMYESILLTMIGSVLGILFGGSIILYYQIYGLDLSYFAEGLEGVGKMGSTIYPSITPKDIIETLIYPLVLSVIAAFFPALKAVKISPVRSIYNR